MRQFTDGILTSQPDGEIPKPAGRRNSNEELYCRAVQSPSYPRRDIMTATTTRTLDVAGATLAYDLRRNSESKEPSLLLIGSPMGAAGFGTLAGHFSDRTIVTYDPRGCDRSVRTDAASLATPAVHADDLHRLIQVLGGLPVDL